MKIEEALHDLSTNRFDKQFCFLYGDNDIIRQKKRYMDAIKKFVSIFPARNDIALYSASGRTEISGNHTDHQNGCVIAAAVNLDVIGVTSFHHDGVIRIHSEGYNSFEVSLDDIAVHNGEKDSSAIVRGIVSKFTEMGVKIGGFDMYTTSDVLSGSGISSSAAFENLISTAINLHYNHGKTNAVEIAKIGQYAENVYFGKNSGLMDQMVSSVGGFVFIDFKELEAPLIKRIDFDFRKTNYEIIITDTKGSHFDMTDDYAEVRSEMSGVADYFGKNVLREVDEAEFWENMPDIRNKISDRAVLRAVHFFRDNERVIAETQALSEGRFEDFLALVNESGNSSMNLLQNLYSCRKPTEQAIPLAIMAGKRILKDKGAVRVHGGGFAGTIQSFVPSEMVDEYKAEMDRIFGQNSCYVMNIRPVGGVEII